MDLPQQLVSIAHFFTSQTPPDQESINNATNQLLEMFKLPQTIFVCFDLLVSTQEFPMKMFLATCLNQILNDRDKWLHYQQSEESEKIKNIFIQILSNEANPTVFNNILHSAKSILSIEGHSWPEFITLIQQFAANPASYLAALRMSNSLVDAATEELVINLWELFCNLSLQGLTISNEDIILESSHLIAHLFNFASEKEDNLPQLFMALFQTFATLMANDSSICGNIIDDFDSIAQQYSFPNTPEIIQMFVSVIMNQNFDIDNRCLSLISAINFFISDVSNDMDELLPSLVEVILATSVNSFLEDTCSEYQENMNIVQESLSHLLEISNAKVIYSVVQTKSTGGNSPAEIATYANCLTAFANMRPDLLIPDISLCIKFGFACVETPHHCIQEYGFDLFASLFTRKSDAYYGIQKQFFETTFKVFGIDHHLLILKALNSISEYLDIIEIDSEFIGPVLTTLCQIFEKIKNTKIIDREKILSTVIDCFISLTKSLETDIVPYLPQLAPLVISATLCQNPEEMIIKASGIECLGYIIRFNPQLPEIEAIIQRFVECIQSGDNILTASGFQAIRQVVAIKLPQVAPVLPVAFEVAHNILQTEMALFDDEDKEELNEYMLDLWKSTMSFISKVAKTIPESLPNVINVLKTDLINIIENEVKEDLQSAAIRTTATLIKLIPTEIPSFLERIIEELINTSGSKVAIVYIQVISEFIENSQQVPVPQNIIECCNELCLQGIRRELSFQDDEKGYLNYDIDFGSSLYYYFKIIAGTAPQLFPMNEFLKCAQIILSKGENLERCEVISVFTEVYISSFNTIPSLMKKKIIRDIFVQTLPLCDCYSTPDPIAAVKAVVEREPDLLKQYLPNIMGFIDQLLATEYEDQFAYYMTMEYTVSLLFSLFRVVFKEQFDVQKYLMKMLSFLPEIVENKGVQIYSKLVSLCGELPHIMSHFSPEIIRVFSQTFALKDKEWNKLNLPVDVAKSASVILLNLLGAMQQGSEILAVSLPDQQSRQRYEQRIGYFISINIE
ncbi:hypothetical protein TRFO_30181 [Tritrichomonas foetus]|uniref:Importin N-terminal domain-containing protein n=1 Tax=Tritrichomonas foetus TaxID=1144522 RepID=A0A1J4JVD1_9EUKA|nr:hypothetical protein TRFO_30181 [Tritrichomonas foetus]|eukprot:OHT02682.1 hypothetical protein TRFO_30181 [Tritrichomonas foetus]